MCVVQQKARKTKYIPNIFTFRLKSNIIIVEKNMSTNG